MWNCDFGANVDIFCNTLVLKITFLKKILIDFNVFHLLQS